MITPALLRWTVPGRILVFGLAAMSIGCLLAEMAGLMPMCAFTPRILLPAMAALYGIAVLDRFRGDRRLWRAVVLGTLAGLAGAVLYDLFRLPFVLAGGMPLFKVFPRFGAMILGQPMEQASYAPAAQFVGWAYHFSNGAGFGVMFAALIGEASHRWGAGWPWAVLMAAGIEACLLVSPYPAFFGIHLTARFVAVTLAAHLVFGAGMGLCFAWGTTFRHPIQP